uniref:F-box domain-containing protein n=1 Tax=Oryza barthii TaxID=65489 RepID=A0A0D3GIH1_9ORYZ
MAAPPPPPPRPRHPVADNDDLVGEILLRIPPDDPTRLVRASAVCKRWRRVLADPSFAARHRAFHPRAAAAAAAPVLGVLHNPADRELDRFVPAAASSFRAAAGDRRKHHILDCRHGRVVLYDYDSHYPTDGHIVWDPITGEQHRIPNVMDALTHPAVISGAAAGGGGGSASFIVAFVGVQNWERHFWDAHACFYSSETGEWSVHINIHLDLDGYHLEDRPAALVGGDTLYFVGKSGILLRYRYGLPLRCGRDILGYGITSADVLSVVDPPPGVLHRHKLALWDREEDGSAAAAARWVWRVAIDLEQVLPWPVGNTKGKERACLAAVAEDPNVIFVGTEEDGVFAVELDSLRIKKVCELGKSQGRFFPFVSYCAESFLSQSDSDTIAKASSDCGQFGDLIECILGYCSGLFAPINLEPSFNSNPTTFAQDKLRRRTAGSIQQILLTGPQWLLSRVPRQ